jgi:hypothetical protein
MRRKGRFIVIAAAIHCGIAAIAIRMPSRLLEASNLRSAAATEFEIAVERPPTFPTAESAAAKSPMPATQANVGKPRRAQADVDPSEPNANSITSDTSAEPFHFSGLAASAEQRGAFHGGTTTWTTPYPGADHSGTRDKSDPGGLRDALGARDVEHGYGNLGAVTTAVNAALREAGAPQGSARYELQIAADGSIRAFLLRADKDDAAFKKLEPLLAKHVGASSYKARDRGMRVTVDVKVWQQFVDGTKPEDLGRHAEASLGEATVSKDGVITMTKPPGLILSTRGKLGSIGVYVGPTGVGLAGGVSPENAGSPSRSMTSAKVVSAVPM